MPELPVCPNCGTPQQWEMWRRCSCGYDFGPAKIRPSQPPPEIEGQARASANRYRYSTFWARFIAGFIDGLVFLPVSLLDLYFGSVKDVGTGVAVAWCLVSYSAYWVYSVALHARFGQTVGKMATGVIVLDASEKRLPTWRQAFWRDSVYIILNVASMAYAIWWLLSSRQSDSTAGQIEAQWLGWANLGWFFVEVVSMLSNKRRRALHDFIGGTVVIRKLRK